MHLNSSRTDQIGKLKLLTACILTATLAACGTPTTSSSSSVSSSSVSSSSSSVASNGSQPADLGTEPSVVAPSADQDVSGYVIYELPAEGETVFDTARPVVVSGDGNEYTLPYPHIFDYGTPNSIVLDDFADNDHQNNLGGALATYVGENYTEGGGYWYTFAADNASLTNEDGLEINAYNIGEAINGNELHLIIKSGDYAGVGTNILFEESGIDLRDLIRIEITAYGSGTTVPMVETTDIDKPANWGNYAALSQKMTLSAQPKVFSYEVSEFEGEGPDSGVVGPLNGDNGAHLAVASKLFFQSKDNAAVDLHVQKIEFFFSGTTEPTRLAGFDWKNDEYDPDFVFDESTVGVPAIIDEPYIDWATVPAVSQPGTQQLANTKTAAELADTGRGNWLHREGTKLFDTHGHMVRLTGVNWFGFETKNSVPFGLWARSYKDMLDQIKSVGFNTVRIPFSDYIIDASRDGSITLADLNIDTALNGVNGSDTPLDLMDDIINYARDIDLKIVIDNHSRGPDKYLVEGWWVTDEYSEQRWIDNWVLLAKRYANNDAVVGIDINNEPHFDSYWGSGNIEHDWNIAAQKCANAILAVNPNALIIIEGVERLAEDSEAVNSYWWGGNFQGARTTPLDINDNSKLVYSPHEYGPEVYVQPWFRDYRFPNNLRYIWEDRFGFIYNEGIGHTFVGEFGIKENIAGSAAVKWFDEFVAYMGERSEGYSWTYWAWNPNSGDTGGILQNNWEDVHTWKVNKLKPSMAPIIGNENGK